MTATGTLLIKYRLSTNIKIKQKYIKRHRQQINLLKRKHMLELEQNVNRYPFLFFFSSAIKY